MLNQSYAHAISETITTKEGETVTQVTPEAFHAMAINFAIETEMAQETLGDEYGAWLDEMEARDRAMLDLENSVR